LEVFIKLSISKIKAMGITQWVNSTFCSGLTVILLIVSIFECQSADAQKTAVGFRGGIMPLPLY
jgi:hypothetical protein